MKIVSSHAANLGNTRDYRDGQNHKPARKQPAKPPKNLVQRRRHGLQEDSKTPSVAPLVVACRDQVGTLEEQTRKQDKHPRKTHSHHQKTNSTRTYNNGLSNHSRDAACAVSASLRRTFMYVREALEACSSYATLRCTIETHGGRLVTVALRFTE